jgi:hypothetical protein
MVPAQKAKKIALFARVAGQQIGTQAARSRTGSAVLKGLRATASSLGGALHQLWLEITGFVFLVIAAAGAYEAFREYGKYHGGQEPGPSRLILAVCFTVSFAWFGLSSFVRVRKKKNT